MSELSHLLSEYGGWILFALLALLFFLCSRSYRAGENAAALSTKAENKQLREQVEKLLAEPPPPGTFGRLNPYTGKPVQTMIDYRNYQKAYLDDLERSLDSRRAELDLSFQRLAEDQRQFGNRVRDRVVELCRDISGRPYLRQSPPFATLFDPAAQKRAVSALTPDMEILPPFNLTARVKGSQGTVYEVSLFHCTCRDFQIHQRPCKHMYRLAMEVGLLLSVGPTLDASYREELDSLAKRRDALAVEISGYSKQAADLKREKEALQRIRDESSQRFPFLADLYAEYYDIALAKIERDLLEKHPPAKESAKRVASLRRELRPLNKRVNELEHQLRYLTEIFPWLDEFVTIPPKDAYLFQTAASGAAPDAQDEYEVLRNWLSPEEYQALPRAEKYQRALDRYQRRKKTDWEIGIEYERYIGYLCERQGYRVEYSGALMGLADMGRDLVLTAGEQTVVIQCKRWAKEKTLHEKHIFQLFGTCYLLSLQRSHVIGAFVTTAALSDVALQCARQLDIRVYEHIPIGEYPCVKCNVSRSGERIYHLPFDQQYDHVVIDPSRGEFYAFTVAEAEDAGFRRAFRWHGD